MAERPESPPQVSNAWRTLETRGRIWSRHFRLDTLYLKASSSRAAAKRTYTSIKCSYPFSRFAWVKPIRIGSNLCGSTRSLFVHLGGNESRFSWIWKWGGGGTAKASSTVTKAASDNKSLIPVILKQRWWENLLWLERSFIPRVESPSTCTI